MGPDEFERDPDKLLGSRRRPRGWKAWTYELKVEWVATRMLAEDREGVTSHKLLKESGILSPSQYERRLNREVPSNLGSLEDKEPEPGVFGRVHSRDLRGVRDVEKNGGRYGDKRGAPVRITIIPPADPSVEPNVE